MMFKKIVTFGLILVMGTHAIAYTSHDVTRLNFEFLIALENGDASGVFRCFKRDVDVNQLFQGPVVSKSMTPLMLEISRLQKQEAVKSNWAIEGVYSGVSIVILGLLLHYLAVTPLQYINGKLDSETMKALLDDPASFFKGDAGKDNGIRAIRLLGSMASLAIIPMVTVPYAKKFKKGALNGWKKLERQKIIVELIKHPKLDIKKEVNGVSALSLIQDMLKVEKDEAFKVVLKLFEQLILKRIQEDLKPKNKEAGAQNQNPSVTVSW